MHLKIISGVHYIALIKKGVKLLFNFSDMKNIKSIISNGANKKMTNKEFLEAEIRKWKKSKKRKDMITGEMYYEGDHDILKRQRTALGKDGKLEIVENLPNNRVVDNQYAEMVDQKKNYLLSKLLAFNTESTKYSDELKHIFDRRFHKTLKNVGENALNGGISYLYPYYDERGEFKFKRFKSYEILPFWKDEDHEELDSFLRLYEVEGYEGTKDIIIEKVEYYTLEGIEYYTLENGQLIVDIEKEPTNYMNIMNTKTGEVQGYNWEKIPLVGFKYNTKEIPLIKKVKSLQDGINIMLSDFENNMQEDSRNTILVIENYDGTNLGEFRHNLMTYGAVKVRNMDGNRGGVSTLTVEVNAENYKVIIKVFKEALIKNAKGYDSKDERMSGTPNQMNIQSMYNNIDLDANDMETEFQAAFEDLMWFVNNHLINTGKGDFSAEELNIVFNRAMVMNESELIDNVVKSTAVISDETALAKHPWVSDVNREIERMKEDEDFSFAPDVGGDANEDREKE